jgi:hypothetical protein
MNYYTGNSSNPAGLRTWPTVLYNKWYVHIHTV